MVKSWMFKGPLLAVFSVLVTFPFLAHIWQSMPWYQVVIFAVIGFAISVPMYAPRNQPENAQCAHRDVPVPSARLPR